jgi:hypothetical protein
MAASTHKLLCLAAMTVLAFQTTNALAAQPGAVPGRQAVQATGKIASAATATRERGELSRALTTKWGLYVQRAYGVQSAVWAKRMAPNLAMADIDNLRNALKRDTFEGAMAELGGAGAKLSDDRAISVLAAADGRGPTPKALGALNNDLVYTPVAPCRIIDTRSQAAGAIAANSTRSFVAINASNFTSQGGSASNCGTLGLNATAVAINLTAVTPAGGGYATAYPFGTAQPVAASLNYAGNDVVNNSLIVQIPNPLGSFDFTLYTFAQSHYVADIVGYFAPPVTTALQCVDTANATVSGIAPGGTANANAPACAAGYTQTATNCESSSWLVPFVFFHNGTCSARNNDTTAQDIRASRTCCRIPGR